MALPKIPSLMPGDGGDVMGTSSLLLGDTQPWGNQGREGRAREGIPAPGGAAHGIAGGAF